LVRLDVHHFAEDVRVHSEQGAEEECLPGKLRNVIEPTAQDEDKEIAGLDENVERRAALERNGARVVDANGEQKSEEPGKNAKAGIEPEKK